MLPEYLTGSLGALDIAICYQDLLLGYRSFYQIQITKIGGPRGRVEKSADVS